MILFFTGCPTDYSIMGVLGEVNNSARALQADFDAFKFPTSDVVQFRALVTPCIPRYQFLLNRECTIVRRCTMYN